MHRAFASVPETCKDQMEAVLKQKLTAAFARSESWSVDWEKEPLPVLVFVFVFYYNECGIPDSDQIVLPATHHILRKR